MSEPADQIFISYSRRDARVADRVAAALSAAGFSVWIDRAGIRGGELWRQQIVSAINDCQSFLLLISPHSIQSDNVRKELDLAEQAGRTVLPATLVQADIPETLQYQLAGVQIVDLQADFRAGIGELLVALGVEPSAAPQQSTGLLRSVLAGTGAMALCAATLPLLGKAGLLEENDSVAAGIAPQLPAWLWDAGPLTFITVIAVLTAIVAFGGMRAGRSNSPPDERTFATALAIYLLLVVPGTLLLRQYVAMAAAVLVAGGAWALHARAGRRSLSRAAALAMTLVPVLPVIGNTFWVASQSSPFEKANLYLPNPCVKAEDAECDPPTEAPDLEDEALRMLADRMRETVSRVFGETRALLPYELEERLQAEENLPLLRLVNTVELHEGCAGEDSDRRLYALLMSPQLRLQDGRVIRIQTPIGFSACRSEFELQSLKAARVLLQRIQALNRDRFADEKANVKGEFTEQEVMHIRRQIVREWYVALKYRAIENAYPPAEWAEQKGVLDEQVEKELIEEQFPEIYASKEFAMADFIWRGDEPAFTDDDVKRILARFPAGTRTDAETAARDALAANLASLAETDD